MRIDDATGEVTPEEETAEDNVRPLRRPRSESRRTSIYGSSSSSTEDAKTLAAHARHIEVEGASDRLGIVALRETLDSSEAARRILTQDALDARERHEAEVYRVRDEYERAADASESRHANESRRWRAECERLQKAIEDLEEEVKQERKQKKKQKRLALDAQVQIETLREEGKSKRAVLGLLAPGVPPLAEEFARRAPDLFAFVGSIFGGAPPARRDDETVLDRAAAIRFAGRLFEPQNEAVLEDLKRLAFDIVDDGKKAVFVSEWDRVQRYIWSALRREAEAANPKREVVDESAPEPDPDETATGPEPESEGE